MNRVGDALVAAAAADVARHGFAYLVVVRLWILDQERSGLHDLAGLAEPALRNVQLPPRLLHGVIAGRMQAFDGRDLAADHVGHRGDAGADGLLVDDHGACAAQRLATAVFRAGQAGLIAEEPEQRKIGIAVPVPFLTIDLQFDHDMPRSS